MKGGTEAGNEAEIDTAGKQGAHLERNQDGMTDIETEETDRN